MCASYGTADRVLATSKPWGITWLQASESTTRDLSPCVGASELGRVFCSGCVSASSSVCSSVSASAVGSCEMSMSRPSDPAVGVDGPVMLRQREQGRGPGRGTARRRSNYRKATQYRFAI
eukprot:scaffold80554_cov61-Phaeocystis_antarctica.AAC.1